MAEVDIEVVYDAMAEAIDAVGPEQAELLLVKFALLLSRELEDTERVLGLLGEAGKHLEVGLG